MKRSSRAAFVVGGGPVVWRSGTASLCHRRAAEVDAASVGAATTAATATTTATTTAATPAVAAAAESFPFLQSAELSGLVYLDSASTSQKPEVVLDALEQYYSTANANVHRGAHTLAARATDQFEGARDSIGELIGARTRDEVIFTRNATEAINLVAETWGRVNLQAGDEVLLSVAEHHSNWIPWSRAAERAGATVVAVPLPEGADVGDAVVVEHFTSFIRPGVTKLISVSQISHVLGGVADVAGLVAAAKAADPEIRVLVDACQSIAHMPISVEELGCDWLVASGHKMYGPSGIGFLWGKRELLEEMPPFMGGGEMIAEVLLESSTYAALPHKFEAGTPAIGEAVGLGAAARFLMDTSLASICAYERSLNSQLVRGLGELGDAVTMHSSAHAPTLSTFSVSGYHPSDVSALANLDGVAVRAGRHQAHPLYASLRLPNGATRASLAVFNSDADVRALVTAVAGAIEAAKLAGNATAN